ncbi:MAG TPA: MtrB/PioB family decaheme-associated outer membrane protein, partial [Azonexus sp.]|nr:MtrB/PioB family decaheme-associated outer membrane protein [Azonexus sp.]
PIDSTIRQVEGTLSYTSKTWQLSGGYYGSWYDNKNSLVSVYPVFTTAASGIVPAFTGPTFLSLPLDNQAHQLFLNGGYSFTPTTRATLKLSYSRATQNEHLPTQDIAGLSRPGSPSSLEGEVNTTLVQLGVTSRPIKDLSLLANLRYHNVDDATPVNRFVTTNVNCGAGQCVDNTPLSYKTLTGKLEGTYRVAEGYSLTAGVEERQQDRKVPVSNAKGVGGSDTQRVVPLRYNVDETTWRLELRRSLSEVLNGSVSYLNSQRTGSNYIFAAGPGNDSTNGFVNISNQINPINIADRDRNKVRLAVDWTPIESLSFQFTAEEGRDKYDHDSARSFGLQDGTARLYGVDASYTLSDKWKINAWYSYDYSQAKQKAARASNGGGNAAIKDYDLEDAGNSFGLGLRGEITARIKLGADLQWARNVSKYQQTVTALNGTAGTNTVANFVPGLPDIENKMTRLSVFSIYSLDKTSDLRIDVIGERWETNDWSWMFANGTAFTYGTTTDGTTVTANPRQTSTFVGLRYIYKFQ